jgi:hypothetical protein
MIEHRRSAELGGSSLGWLKALHHFAIGLPLDYLGARFSELRED